MHMYMYMHMYMLYNHVHVDKISTPGRGTKHVCTMVGSRLVHAFQSAARPTSRRVEQQDRHSITPQERLSTQ